MIVQSAQALCRHWSLHRAEVDAHGRAGLCRSYREDSVVRDLRIVRIPQVPRQPVEIAEDMAAGAGAVAAARREGSVVKKRPAFDHAFGLGIEHRHLAKLTPLPRIHDRNGIVEPCQHVQTMVLLIQCEATRPTS